METAGLGKITTVGASFILRLLMNMGKEKRAWYQMFMLMLNNMAVIFLET